MDENDQSSAKSPAQQQAEQSAKVTETGGLRVIHAQGLEHHLQSGVTSRAPEPGAPIARGEPIGARRASPAGPSQIIPVGEEVHGQDARMVKVLRALVLRVEAVEENLGDIVRTIFSDKSPSKKQLEELRARLGVPREPVDIDADAPSSEN